MQAQDAVVIIVFLMMLAQLFKGGSILIDAGILIIISRIDIVLT